jgi:hypothetical protein
MNWGSFAAVTVETEGDEKIFAFGENFDTFRYFGKTLWLFEEAWYLESRDP